MITVVNPGFAHIGVESMAQIMKPEVGDPGLSTGIRQGLLDFPEGPPPIGEDPLVPKMPHLTRLC